MAWADAGLSPQYSTERTLRQKKALWELFQNECVQISASLICHSKETQNEFKYHPLRIWSMSNTAPKWFKKNNGAHLPYNSPVGCYQQIKNSDVFFLFKLPSNMCRGKPQISGAEHRNDCDNYQPTQFSDPLSPSFCSSTYVVLWLPRQ